MTSRNGTGPTTTTRAATWRRHLGASASVSLAALLALVGTAWWAVDLAVPCTPDFSEATIVAPDSYRGRLLCSVTDGELGTSVIGVGVLAGVPLLALVVTVLGWIRGRSWRWLVLGCMVVVVLPWVVRGALHALPAGCTMGQRDAYGSAGCERDEELRPGLGQYGG